MYNNFYGNDLPSTLTKIDIKISMKHSSGTKKVIVSMSSWFFPLSTVLATTIKLLEIRDVWLQH